EEAGGSSSMSKRYVLIFAIAAVVTRAVPGRADERDVRTSDEPGALSGLVVDLQDSPVAGAPGGGGFRLGKVRPVPRGTGGRCLFRELAPDKPVTLWVDSPALARGRRDDVRIFPGKAYDVGRMTLLPGTRLSGRAVDTQGEKVVRAHVVLDLYRYQLGHTIS